MRSSRLPLCPMLLLWPLAIHHTDGFTTNQFCNPGEVWSRPQLPFPYLENKGLTEGDLPKAPSALTSWGLMKKFLEIQVWARGNICSKFTRGWVLCTHGLVNPQQLYEIHPTLSPPFYRLGI